MHIFINAKAYEQASAKNADKFLKKLESAKHKVTVCLQPGDVHLSKSHKTPVWSQHVDPITPGAHTGWILPENMKANGAKGVLINHSEHRTKELKATIKRCKEVGLKTMLLVPRSKDIIQAKKLKPDFLGVEPPELIGSKTVSVADKPKIIETALKNAGKIPLFVGAGIHSAHDYKVCKEMGVYGLLIASAIVKAKNPTKALDDLFKK